MSTTWTLAARAGKQAVEDALVRHEDALDWNPAIVLTGREARAETPDDWVLEAYVPHRPTRAEKTAFAALFVGTPPAVTSQRLPETDWVTLSQQGMDPVRAGPFYVRTPEHSPCPDFGVRDFVIPASQAFGTGHHETTAGCLEMLAAMRCSGVVARDAIDVGTGTGVLAFAAMHLWPGLRCTASDIDAVCAPVVLENAVANSVATGGGRNALTMVVAPGVADPLIAARGPYNLVIANILAGPLQDLARDFADITTPGGSVLLAGLLETQEPAVRAAYRAAGFRLAARLVRGDWSILWLRRRRLP